MEWETRAAVGAEGFPRGILLAAYEKIVLFTRTAKSFLYGRDT